MGKRNQWVLAFALMLLSGVLFAIIVVDHPSLHSVFDGNTVVPSTIGGVLLAAAILLVITAFDDGRSSALIRLDWFFPALRKQKPGRVESHSLPGRLLRRILPNGLQSNRKTKQRGQFRKLIRKLGPAWMASPVRRCVQVACLLLFSSLFFYVCWPYDAKPVGEGPVSNNWTFQTIDSESGDFIFQQAKLAENSWRAKTGQSVYVAQDSVSVGDFIVKDDAGSEARLGFRGDLTADVLDTFYSSNSKFDFYQNEPGAWPSHYANNLASKELIHAETFLIIDPLVSLSTAVASRSWVWSLTCAAAILIVCVLIPRGFCGYICPLGTTIDFFDWLVTGRTKRFQVSGEGWWVHIKYYLLAGTLVAATCGVLLSGFVSAIPVITRGLLFFVDPVQSGVARGWHLIPAWNTGHLISMVLFIGVLSLGFMRPRFWCKYVCPSGAVFSLGNLFRVTERKVESSCINCNKCVEICPFDAIKPDFTTRTTDCTMCQSCGGVCPTHAIKFVERWNVVELKIENDPPTNETSLGRRGFLSLAAGGAAAVAGGAAIAVGTKTFGAKLDDLNAFRPVRPPGSVPEKEFLEMCIRCGECFKACPNNVLQPQGFQQGLEGLWTPIVNADWAGCESSCNACGQVCPTGAIRALPLAEKKSARMGLAVVNETTCLPFAGKEDCDLCVQECNAAGYEAIEFTQVGTEVDDDGQPIEGTGFLAPVILDEKCVGCGLCQTRCYGINVKEKHILSGSAIVVHAGDGKEDRMMSGSYIEQTETQPGTSPIQKQAKSNDGATEPVQPPQESEDPFGLSKEDPFGIDR